MPPSATAGHQLAPHEAQILSEMIALEASILSSALEHYTATVFWNSRVLRRFAAAGLLVVSRAWSWSCRVVSFVVSPLGPQTTHLLKAHDFDFLARLAALSSFTVYSILRNDTIYEYQRLRISPLGAAGLLSLYSKSVVFHRV